MLFLDMVPDWHDWLQVERGGDVCMLPFLTPDTDTAEWYDMWRRMRVLLRSDTMTDLVMTLWSAHHWATVADMLPYLGAVRVRHVRH